LVAKLLAAPHVLGHHRQTHEDLQKRVVLVVQARVDEETGQRLEDLHGLADRGGQRAQRHPLQLPLDAVHQLGVVHQRPQQHQFVDVFTQSGIVFQSLPWDVPDQTHTLSADGVHADVVQGFQRDRQRVGHDSCQTAGAATD